MVIQLLLALVPLVCSTPVPYPTNERVVYPPVPLADVRLDSDTWQGKQQQTTLDYMTDLEPGRLLYNFHVTANISTGAYVPYGGWEAPSCQLRGHFVGHFMSASAFMWASTGDETVKKNMEAVVSGIATCQRKIGTGFVAAFPSTWFDMLEDGQPVWAPYYTIHKIMAGLYDQYMQSGNQLALEVATWMSEYFYDRTMKFIARKGEPGWQKVLNVEWGGMNEVLYNLYAITGNEKQLKFGKMFDHFLWTTPLELGYDNLVNNHANTHIPEIIGTQRGYEITGNKTQLLIATVFLKYVGQNHSWATGGSNSWEYWHAPSQLGQQLTLWTEESCTSYNTLKVLRHFFEQTGDIKYANWYERLITNGIIGNQHWNMWGEYIYMLPQGGGNITKGKAQNGGGPVGSSHIRWGDRYNSFWCCYGTLFESFAKLGDSIYFIDPSNNDLMINQYVGSTYRWREFNALLHWSVTNITTSLKARLDFTQIDKSGAKDGNFGVKIRIPGWASEKSTVQIRDDPPIPATPNTYFHVIGDWVYDVDNIQLSLIPSIWAEHVQDPRPEFNNTYAVMYGPMVLAGVVTQHSNSSKLDVPMADIAHHMTMDATPTQPLASATWTLTEPGSGRKIPFMPFFQVMDQTYTVYWNQGPLMPPVAMKQFGDGFNKGHPEEEL